MARKTKQEEAIRPEAAVSTELIRIKLSDIREDRELYCHRDAASLEPNSIKLFAEQILREGLQTLLEVTVRDGVTTLIKGHRRVAALKELARTNQHGYSLDMEVPAFRVVDADLVTLLVRSVSDNENRKNYDAHERIRAAKTMYDHGAPTPRAASAMGISVSSFERALLIAQHTWMFELIAKKCVDPTPAYTLLAAATKAKRLEDLQRFLGRWIAIQDRKIQAKRVAKAEVGKELSAAESSVKRYMQTYLWRAWTRQLKAGEELQYDAKWRFGAELDPETRRLSIASLNLNLARASHADVADIRSKLAALVEDLRTIRGDRQADGTGSREASQRSGRTWCCHCW